MRLAKRKTQAAVWRRLTLLVTLAVVEGALVTVALLLRLRGAPVGGRPVLL